MNGINAKWTVHNEESLQYAEAVLSQRLGAIQRLREVLRQTWRPDLQQLLTLALEDYRVLEAEVKRQWCAWLRAGGSRSWA